MQILFFFIHARPEEESREWKKGKIKKEANNRNKERGYNEENRTDLIINKLNSLNSSEQCEYMLK